MDNVTIDLFESVLQTAGCKEYIDVFRKHGVDAQILPTLTEADLLVIGVDKETERKELLSQAANLQIPKEPSVKIKVDGEFAVEVINNMTQQVHLLNTYFVYAMSRDDIIYGDVKLKPATRCLLLCTASLGKQIEYFYGKYNGWKKKHNRKRKNCILLTSFLLSSAMAGYIFKKLCL